MADSAMDLYKEIGLRIKEIRKQKNMSQQTLSEQANISLPQISDYECGKVRMQVASLAKIAEALQVSTDLLIRPNIPQVNTIYQTEFQEILGDCTPTEIDSILKIVRELKTTMHKKNKYDS